MNKQKGSAHVIIIVGLVVLIISLLGLSFWQNYKIKNNETDTSKIDTAAGSDKSSDTNLDMITYDPAVEITDEADISALKNAPESFKKFIIASIGKDNNSAEAAQSNDCFSIYTVEKIYKQKYAAGGVGAGGECEGGAAVLWGMVDGEWKDISGTQNVSYPCVELEQYKVPSAIAGTTCYDPNSPNFSRSYNQT